MLEAVILTAALMFGRPSQHIENFDKLIVCKVVQHEAGGLSKDYKRAVAEVIRARIEAEDFPDNVSDVVFQGGQFFGAEDWIYSPEWLPDSDTIAAVDEAFSAEKCHGCVYYYNPELSTSAARRWFEYSGDVEFVFSITEKSWGVEYETRFFRAKNATHLETRV